MAENWIPNLAGRVDPQVEIAIRYLYQAVYALRDKKPDEVGKGENSKITGADLVGSPPTLIRKGPGPGTYTGFTKITLDENGRVIAIS